MHSYVSIWYFKVICHLSRLIWASESEGAKNVLSFPALQCIFLSER